MVADYSAALSADKPQPATGSAVASGEAYTTFKQVQSEGLGAALAKSGLDARDPIAVRDFLKDNPDFQSDLLNRAMTASFAGFLGNKVGKIAGTTVETVAPSISSGMKWGIEKGVNSTVDYGLDKSSKDMGG